MKRILICLILLCGCAGLNPMNSVANENNLISNDLFSVNSEEVVKIEILSGVTGERKSIVSEESIAEIIFIFNTGNFVEYEKAGNAGGWLYNFKIYFSDNEMPFEYTISYGFEKDEKNYRLEDETDLKKAAEKIFGVSAPENFMIVSCENGDVVIKINEKIVEFNHAPFIDENGRTQVPVRELCEYLNKRVYWVENPQRVAISTVSADLDNTDGGDSIEFVIGENAYSKNGKEHTMDTAARIINNHTYIPLRAAGEFLNYDVIWRGNI